MKKIVLLMFLLALSSKSVTATSLKLTSGTWSVGGGFAMPYKYDRVGRQTISFHEEPEISYFIWDSLRLLASLEFEMSLRWSRIYPVTLGRVFWGGKIGAEYIFDVGHSIYPFAGLKMGARVRNVLLDQTQLLVEFPIGILWAMNEHVAISFAVPVQVAFTGLFKFESVEVTPGYFGGMVFF